jgi:hypothetical protein
MAVHRNHAEPVIAGARVVERIAVRIRARRALRQVIGHEGGPELLPSPSVEEVIAAVVGAEADLRRPVPLGKDVGLPRPARPAPIAGYAQIGGPRAQAPGGRIPPEDRRAPGNRPLAVVAAGGIAAEGRQAGKPLVDRGGGRGRRTPVARRSLLHRRRGGRERAREHREVPRQAGRRNGGGVGQRPDPHRAGGEDEEPEEQRSKRDGRPSCAAGTPVALHREHRRRHRADVRRPVRPQRGTGCDG